MCWFKVQDGPCRGYPGQHPEEGLLSYHARVHEGGCAAFLHTSTGRIILIQNGSSAMFDTPYRNKYGEAADPNLKKWDTFHIDEQGGGLEVMRSLKQKFIKFQVANSILQQRCNPDAKYKTYVKNAI